MSPSVDGPSGDDSRVWFITGASRGLGRAFAEAALARGDRVVGAARDVAPLQRLAAKHDGRLVAYPLDVTDRAAVFAAVDRAATAFGRLDVVVNSAGQLLAGMVEETTEAQARTHLDTNFFGALWVSQAVVGHLREQGSGHILQIAAVGAGSGSGSYGVYGAGKAALSAVSEALAAEVEPFGVKVTVLEPGPYSTGLFQATTATTPDPAYAPVRAALRGKASGITRVPGPDKAAAVVLEIVDMAQPPKRVVLGSWAYEQAQRIEERRSAEFARWEHLSRAAD